MLNTALFGVGGIGRRLASELRDHPETALAAALDVNPRNLEEARIDSEKRYTDEERLYAERGDRLDAVVIATPPAFHARQIEVAADRGLHVLCEKPLVADREEARAVVERFSGSSETLMVCYQRHLDPAFRRGYERFHGGGHEPTFLTGQLTQDWRAHFGGGGNWRTDPAVGVRGHLFSVGTHVLESMLWMTGLVPESVSAEMAFHDDEIDTQSALSIRFTNGAIASMADSAVVPAQREHLRIWDDEGALEFRARDWGEPTLTRLDGEGRESVVEVDPSERETKVAAFVGAIESGEEPPATATDALRVTALLDAAYESARIGERVDVDL